MTSKRNRLATLERVVDVELDARARRVVGLDGGSITWAEFAGEYREVSERHEAIRERLRQSPENRNGPADIEAEVRMLAQEVGLDFEELMAEAESITARSELDPQATRRLLSRL